MANKVRELSYLNTSLNQNFALLLVMHLVILLFSTTNVSRGFEPKCVFSHPSFCESLN